MNLSMSGLPAIVMQVGFIVVFSAPVWLAAKIIGAERPTLIRSALSLIVGVIGSIVAVAVGGGWAFLLVPIAFLLAFKFVLGTSIAIGGCIFVEPRRESMIRISQVRFATMQPGAARAHR
jgi:hypothetical protein